MDLGAGNTEVLSCREALHYLRLPGVSAANMQNTTSAAAARIGDGGFHYRDQLRPSIQAQIDPRLAFCTGINALEDRGFRIYPVMLDKPEIRKLIRKAAAEHFTATPIIVSGTELRGGSEKVVIPLPGGRTLFRYCQRFRESGYDEMSLPDQAWKRGNRKHRIALRVVELMENTVTDDGVKAFGLSYTSPALQALKDSSHGKVAVYTDPDCIDHVNIVIEGHQEPVLAELTWAAMKGLTLHEFQEIALAARAEDPDETEVFEARLVRVRRERYEQMQFIATERNLWPQFHHG